MPGSKRIAFKESPGFFEWRLWRVVSAQITRILYSKMRTLGCRVHVH